MKKLYLLFFCFLVLIPLIHASHIVGGEFKLVPFRGDEYILSLNMYFDDIHANPGLINEATLRAHIFRKSDDVEMLRDQSLILERNYNELIPYKNPLCTNSLDDKIKSRLMKFTRKIVLDPAIFNDPQGYYIIWERCCRNEDIVNITDPGNTGQTFYMEFPPVTSNGRPFINHSPAFKDIKGDIGCLNVPFTFDFSATDANGDSLTYRFVTPFKGHSISSMTTFPGPIPQAGFPQPYQPVDWENSYGLENIIPGTPALTISAKTGIITVTPTTAGLFVFAIVCEEYRAGKKIGEVRRDFQFLIENCPENLGPIASVKIPEKPDFDSETDTIEVILNERVCIVLDFTDSTFTEESRTADLNIVSIKSSLPPGVLEITPRKGNINFNNPKLSSMLCIEPCDKIYPSKDSLYKIEIIVEDDGCPVAKVDTLILNVLLKNIKNETPLVGYLPGNKIMEIEEGSNLGILVFGTDQDSADIISLSAEGLNFDLSEPGFKFNAVSGKDSIHSLLQWQPDCNDYRNRREYKIVFKVADNSCKENKENYDTLTIILNNKETTLLSISPGNLVTPDKDSKNDFFEIPNMPPDNCDVIFKGVAIYNRWGAMIHEGQNRDFKWNPEKFPDGIYFYMVDLNVKKIKGWIHVMRSQN